MKDSLGGITLLLGALVTVYLVSRRGEIAVPLFLGFLLRTIWALVHRFVVPLPDSHVDAVRFEAVGWSWASAGWQTVFANWQTGAHMYSWIISVLYAAFGRSPLMIQGANVLLGTFVIYTVWALTREIFGQKAAKLAAWGATLFPALNLYSAITMREVFIVLATLVGCLYGVRWIRSRAFKHYVVASISFFLAVGFHTGILPILCGLGAWSMFRGVYSVWCSPRKHTLAFALEIVLFLGLTLGIVFGGWGMEKAGLFQEGVGAQQELYARGRAAYLPKLTVQKPWDLFWQGPIRVFYFLFAPFPWWVEKTVDLLGVADALLYWGLCGMALWGLVKDRPKDRRIWFLLCLLCIGVATFAMTTSNYGAAIRHRAKFVPLLLAIAAGMYCWAGMRKAALRRKGS